MRRSRIQVGLKLRGRPPRRPSRPATLTLGTALLAVAAAGALIVLGG